MGIHGVVLLCRIRKHCHFKVGKFKQCLQHGFQYVDAGRLGQVEPLPCCPNWKRSELQPVKVGQTLLKSCMRKHISTCPRGKKQGFRRGDAPLFDCHRSWNTYRHQNAPGSLDKHLGSPRGRLDRVTNCCGCGVTRALSRPVVIWSKVSKLCTTSRVATKLKWNVRMSSQGFRILRKVYFCRFQHLFLGRLHAKGPKKVKGQRCALLVS